MSWVQVHPGEPTFWVELQLDPAGPHTGWPSQAFGEPQLLPPPVPPPGADAAAAAVSKASTVGVTHAAVPTATPPST